ncbi:hypothetical protein [Alkalicoccobacillus gibsonii]|uniref:hypothetical protein n=1 Tax=Alkalicoccobacillus gibsonii TaxID=79881 RepID=UPI0019314FF2|nr:hypothetical protein [Alkalicoccobacillus gibsonii]MBM0064935.1 hypothetical protein [Alkalicoccobacillus gibsonii]
MPYTLKLINALSYSGSVQATARNPFIEIDDEAEALEAEATGYFKIINSDLSKDEEDHPPPNGSDEIDLPALYTEKELLKLKQAEQEEIIQSLNGDPGQAKNAQERVALILKLQEIAQEAGLE